MKKSTGVMLWPNYFDSTKKRREGRRIKRDLAVERPTIEELAKAAEKLGIPYQVDKSAAYPGSWWERSGRMFVGKALSKGRIILSIAKNLRNMRAKTSS
ncbi:MAG: signal recognition particle subunit SRP19/SEC65 family protein [Candidatus Atabeyarchaeum deiterrae]